MVSHHLCFFRYILHAEADSSHLVLAKADNLNFVAKCKNILNTVDPLFGDLGNVYHSLLAGSELDESAEFLDADNSTCEDLSCLKVGGDDADPVSTARPAKL